MQDNTWGLLLWLWLLGAPVVGAALSLMMTDRRDRV